MFKFLTGCWLPILVLLAITQAPWLGLWLVAPVLLIPAWLLYCLLAG